MKKKKSMRKDGPAYPVQARVLASEWVQKGTEPSIHEPRGRSKVVLEQYASLCQGAGSTVRPREGMETLVCVKLGRGG